MNSHESSPTPSEDPCLPPDPALVESQIRAALAEDLDGGDLTASLLPADQLSQVELITREAAVVCGRPWFDTVFRLLDPEMNITWQVSEGERVNAGHRLALLEGRTRALLSGERTAMNYLQTLSGTATRSRRYADAVEGLPVRVLDTRKTLPGLRVQQKYAVRCGGCHNHRMGLYDAILIKENHILAAGSIRAALAAARDLHPGVETEIEVESLTELREALEAGSPQVLLDNFGLADLRQAVELNGGRARLEASGGINLKTIRTVAETGVDRISVGDLTKDVTAVDLSMRFLAA